MGPSSWQATCAQLPGLHPRSSTREPARRVGVLCALCARRAFARRAVPELPLLLVLLLPLLPVRLLPPLLLLLRPTASTHQAG